MCWTLNCACIQYAKPWPHSSVISDLVVANLLMYSLSDMILLYLAAPFYTEGVFA